MSSRVSRFLGFATVLLGALFVYGLNPQPTLAIPDGFSRTQIVSAGLSDTSGFEFAPDGRIFILERTGDVRVFKNGALLSEPFYSFPAAATGDRGLIGVTFDPNFATNNYVYFYYTDVDLRNYLVRLDASGDTFTGVPTIIYQTSVASNLLHVGGALSFGPDGKLYFAIGDNGYPPNSQNLSNPFGKVHRINADGSIPADNPFAGVANKEESIWAYGFRNPYRFQIDAPTGRIFGGDVGDNTWEEVNLIEKGKNYGWPASEGVCAIDCAGLTDPIYAYNHEGTSSAISGGPVYRGSDFPAEYVGDYFFADYARGFIRHLNLDAAGEVISMEVFEPNAGSAVDLKVAPDGSLYYITYYPAALYRVTYAPENQLPEAVATSDVADGIEPLSVSFTGSDSTDPEGTPLEYSWDFGDGTTSVIADPVKTYADVGVYTVILTVSDGVNTSQSIPLVINVGVPPSIIFGAPNDNDMFRAGDEVTFNVFANDGAGFDIDDGSIVTEIIFHQGVITHPPVATFIGRTGTFTIPDQGVQTLNTWYEIRTIATDVNGLSATDSINIYPEEVQVTIDANIAGATVSLDGTLYSAPYEFTGIVQFKWELSAQDTVIIEDALYVFDSWSDGGAQTHVITIPATDTTYTAQYVEAGSAAAGSFETLDANDNPTGVSGNYWGEGTTVFSLSADAHNGLNAGRIDVSGYSSGDAKWYLTPVAVEPETTYTYSAWYKSSRLTKTVADITLADGTHQYIWLGVMGVSSNLWQEISVEIETPVNAAFITVYQYLEGNGWLLVDDMKFEAETVVDPPVGDNIFINGDIEESFEYDPADWSQASWGDNQAIFSTVTGSESDTALRVEITDHVSGNAKWVSTEMDITAGSYSLTNQYRSSVDSAVVVRLIMLDGSSQYLWFGFLATDAAWADMTISFEAPEGVAAVRVEQYINGNGWLETDNYTLTEQL